MLLRIRLDVSLSVRGCISQLLMMDVPHSGEAVGALCETEAGHIVWGVVNFDVPVPCEFTVTWFGGQ